MMRECRAYYHPVADVSAMNLQAYVCFYPPE